MLGNMTLSEIRAALRAKGFDLEKMHREFRELEAQPREKKTAAELEAEFKALIQQFKCLTEPGKSQ